MTSKSVYTSCVYYYDDNGRWDMSLYYAGDFCGSSLMAGRNFHRLFENGAYSNMHAYFDVTGLIV